MKETFNNVHELYDHDEERILEYRIINACITGNLETIQNYCEQHDINKNLYTGWTLLLYVASSVQPELVDYLLNHEADPNKHKDGFTALMALCNSTTGTTEKSLKCLVFLIQAKADVNIENKHRETALMYAYKSQDTQFITELTKYVEDINTSDNDGKTALSYAAAANKPDTIKILLKHNADISLADKYNISAKDIADAKGFKKASALLAEDEEETSAFCEISYIINWKDLFPDLYPKNEKILDYDISVILEGMDL
ncbi:hypothetical protein HN011_004875 [Eciton burchellii]|nr:hypothetical protein HN011_004875 [Eciton burchellii]